MEKININVKSYDEKTNSIVVSYTTDDSEEELNNRDYVYQLHNLNGTPTDILKEIAIAGLDMIKKAQKQKEQQENVAYKQIINDVVGKVYSYNIVDIAPIEPVYPVTNPSQEVVI